MLEYAKKQTFEAKLKENDIYVLAYDKRVSAFEKMKTMAKFLHGKYILFRCNSM
jgi:hypothetical protein